MKLKIIILTCFIFLINSFVCAGEINNNYLFGAYKNIDVEQFDKVAAYIQKHSY